MTKAFAKLCLSRTSDLVRGLCRNVNAEIDGTMIRSLDVHCKSKSGGGKQEVVSYDGFRRPSALKSPHSGKPGLEST